jgi:flagellar assembly protein FliH
MSKTPKTRAAETTHVLRHVDMHHAPHTLVSRGGKKSSLGVERAGRAQSLVMPDDRGIPSPQLPSPQWQAGHRQGYAEGHQAGLEQAQQQLRDQHLRDGFDHGYEEGLAQAQQQLEKEAVAMREKLQHTFDAAVTKAQHESLQTIKRFDQMIQSLPEKLSARMATMEDDMVALCFDMVCRILGEKLVTPQGVRALVSQATKDWPADVDLTIHMHPDDLQRLRTVAADDFVDSSRVSLLDHMSNELERCVRPPLQWVADASMGVGGCVLRSSKGGLDARLMVQLTGLKDTLLAVRAQRGDGGQSMNDATTLTISDLPEPVERTLPSQKEGSQP